jgi:Zn-dependent alcohol dehydrogenase
VVRAVVLSAAGEPVETADDLDPGEPGPGEALVEIVLAGVCGSDLALATGGMPYPTPMVLGHEAVGRVLAAGPGVSGLEQGDRVVLWMRPPCRSCRACVRGEAGLCTASGAMSARGTLPDGRTAVQRRGEPIYRAFGVGAFAEQVVMPVGGLVTVPGDITDEVAALTGCGVATGAGAVLNVARPSPGDTVLVFGAGGVGLSAVMAAAALGAGEVIVADPVPERREAALRFGATKAVAGGDHKALRDQLDGTEVDIAIDAAGRSELVEAGWRVVRQGGTVVAVGIQQAGAQVTLPGPVVTLSHRRLLGCYMGGIDPQRDLPKLFALHRRGALPVDQLVTARRPLTEVGDGLDDLAAGRGLRTIIDIGR